MNRSRLTLARKGDSLSAITPTGTPPEDRSAMPDTAPAPSKDLETCSEGIENGSHPDALQVVDSCREDAQMGNGLDKSERLVCIYNKPKVARPLRSLATRRSAHNTYYVKCRVYPAYPWKTINLSRTMRLRATPPRIARPLRAPGTDQQLSEGFEAKYRVWDSLLAQL